MASTHPRWLGERAAPPSKAKIFQAWEMGVWSPWGVLLFFKVPVHRGNRLVVHTLPAVSPPGRGELHLYVIERISQSEPYMCMHRCSRVCVCTPRQVLKGSVQIHEGYIPKHSGALNAYM